MTPQFHILTMQEKYYDGHGFKPNPFYNKSAMEVLHKFKDAQELYPDLFAQFITVWHFEYQRRMLSEECTPKEEWKELII